jgi:hypothetical protein
LRESQQAVVLLFLLGVLLAKGSFAVLALLAGHLLDPDFPLTMLR